MTVTEGDHPEGWDEGLDSLAGGPLNSAAFATLNRSAGIAEPLFFRWSDSRGTVAQVLGLKRQVASRLPWETGIVSFMEPPARRRSVDAGLESLMDDLREWGRKAGGISELQCHSKGSASLWEVSRFDQHQPAFQMELKAAESGEAALMRMSPRTRRYVRREIRDGVTVGEALEQEELAALAGLWTLTQKRLESKKGVQPADVPAERYAEALEGFVQSRSGKVYLASRGGEILAGGVFLTGRRSAYHVSSGFIDQGSSSHAMHLVIHHALTEFSASGIESLSLGWVPGDAKGAGTRNHGLYIFKTRLGAQPNPVFDGQIDTRNGLTRLAASRLRRPRSRD